MNAPEITNAVLRVGDGRGFIIEAKQQRIIVTAAHCLPWLPETPGWCNLDERTYRNLLGPLGETPPTVWAECLFADPLADIAILGSPDGQELYPQAEAYDALTEERPALRIADAPTSSRAWLLSVAGEWNPCRVTRLDDDHPVALGASLIIKDAAAGIHGGMSGSPIVTADGAAVGILTMSSGIGAPEGTEESVHTGGGPNPRLIDCLPGWLLRNVYFGQDGEQSMNITDTAKTRTEEAAECYRLLQAKWLLLACQSGGDVELPENGKIDPFAPPHGEEVRRYAEELERQRLRGGSAV